MKVKHRVLRHARNFSRHAKDHFIPHRGNNHHPHVLKHHVLLGYSLILIFLKTLAVVGAIVLPASTLEASALTSQNIISLTNAARANVGVPALKTNELLNKAAQAKADDMLQNQYFAHTSPAGLSPWYWIKKVGYNYRYSAENLAVHFTSAEDVQGGWMTSPSHKTNIINTRYSDIGVGIAQGIFEGYQTTFVVQMFGKTQAEDVAKKAGVVPEISEAQNTLPAIKAAVTPYANSYRVQLTAAEVETVSVQMAGKTTDLTKTPGTEEWIGIVPASENETSNDGDRMYVTAVTKDGSTISENVAWVAPTANPNEVFEFNADTHREVTFFGKLTVGSLNDAVRRTYVLFIVFLSCSLLINLAVKFNKQKFSVTAHALLVIGLGLAMYLA